MDEIVGGNYDKSYQDNLKQHLCIRIEVFLVPRIHFIDWNPQCAVSGASAGALNVRIGLVVFTPRQDLSEEWSGEFWDRDRFPCDDVRAEVRIQTLDKDRALGSTLIYIEVSNSMRSMSVISQYLPTSMVSSCVTSVTVPPSRPPQPFTCLETVFNVSDVIKSSR